MGKWSLGREACPETNRDAKKVLEYHVFSKKWSDVHVLRESVKKRSLDFRSRDIGACTLNYMAMNGKASQTGD